MHFAMLGRFFDVIVADGSFTVSVLNVGCYDLSISKNCLGGK